MIRAVVQLARGLLGVLARELPQRFEALFAATPSYEVAARFIALPNPKPLLDPGKLLFTVNALIAIRVRRKQRIAFVGQRDVNMADAE